VTIGAGQAPKLLCLLFKVLLSEDQMLAMRLSFESCYASAKLLLALKSIMGRAIMARLLILIVHLLSIYVSNHNDFH
jgi:hypothetical protein